MEGNQPNVSQACFKEYSCYDFEFNEQETIIKTYDVVFSQINRSNKALSLPVAIIDHNNSTQILYLLQYRTQRNKQLLFVKNLKRKQWNSITINTLPEFIEISGGFLFLIGGGEINIIQLYKQKCNQVRLCDEDIISVHPCIVQYKSAQGKTSAQPGISIIFFQEKLGYNSESYSPHKKIQKKRLLDNIFNYFAPKSQHFLHIEVILPNILAIVFISQDTFCIFNLQTMKVQPQTVTKLISSKLHKDETPLIKWRQHESQEGYNSTLMVLIGLNSNIELFFFSLKYNEILLQNQEVNYSISSLGSNIINWKQILVIPYLTLNVDGNLMVDLHFSKNGILYYSKNQADSQIGQCKYVDLTSLFIQSPILNKEAIIWRTYQQDKSYSENINLNRLFIPNRYPINMLTSMPNVMENRSYTINASEVLNNWRNKYAFKSIIVYEEEMYIVRASSINVFRQIDKKLYDFEKFSEQKLQRINMNYIQQRNKIQQILFTAPEKYQQQLFYGLEDRVLLSQKKYLPIDKDLYDEQQILQKINEASFTQIMNQLREVLQERVKYQYSGMKIDEFKFDLTCNQLYDKLNIYNLIANSKYFRICLDRDRQSNKQSQKYVYIINVLNYFYDLTQRSYQQYKILKDNLISLFIKQHQDLIKSSDIDRNIASILRLLVQNMFPQTITNYKNSQIDVESQFNDKFYNNSYIEFLVHKLTTALDSCEDARGNQDEKSEVWCYRKQLSIIIGLGFLENKSIYFTKFWKHQSIFKALLLSNEPHQVNKYFCQYLLKDYFDEFIELYYQLKCYLPYKQISIIENHLFFNQAYHKLKIDIYPICKLEENPNELEQKYQQYQSTIKFIYQTNVSSQNHVRSFHSINRINSVIDQLLANEQFDEKLFAKLLNELGRISIIEDQQKLQFYEHIIIKMLEIFNCKLKIKGWIDKHSDNRTDDEKSQLFQKKEQLSKYIEVINKYFINYKNTYQSYYQIVQTSSLIQKKHQFEEKLMKQRFIDECADFYCNNGLTCCTISIELMRLAVNSNIQNKFQDSLENKSNLVNFWINCIHQSNYDIEDIPTYLQIIYNFGPKEVKQIFEQSQELKQDIWRKCSNQQSLCVHYKFYKLLFEQTQLKYNTI